MRGNATFLVLMGIAMAITALFLFPYLHDIGHTGVAIAIFAFLGVLLFYGWHSHAPKRTRKN